MNHNGNGFVDGKNKTRKGKLRKRRKYQITIKSNSPRNFSLYSLLKKENFIYHKN